MHSCCFPNAPKLDFHGLLACPLPVATTVSKCLCKGSPKMWLEHAACHLPQWSCDTVESIICPVAEVNIPNLTRLAALLFWSNLSSPHQASYFWVCYKHWRQWSIANHCKSAGFFPLQLPMTHDWKTSHAKVACVTWYGTLIKLPVSSSQLTYRRTFCQRFSAEGKPPSRFWWRKRDQRYGAVQPWAEVGFCFKEIKSM